MIRNRTYMSQAVDFRDLQWGNCRPTDIDLSFDLGGNLFVFVELKFRSSPLTVGQKIHLRGLVDGLRKGGTEAYAILATHETPPDEMIVAADSYPVMVYNGKFWEYSAYSTLKEHLDAIVDGCTHRMRGKQS